MIIVNGPEARAAIRRAVDFLEEVNAEGAVFDFETSHGSVYVQLLNEDAESVLSAENTMAAEFAIIPRDGLA